jgi:hypothetical protein
MATAQLDLHQFLNVIIRAHRLNHAAATRKEPAAMSASF